MLFNVSNTAQEWIDIDTKFKKTMEKAKIEKIERIQNRKLWKIYRNEMEDIKNKNQEDPNCKNMFHGTKSTDPKTIY